MLVTGCCSLFTYCLKRVFVESVLKVLFFFNKKTKSLQINIYFKPGCPLRVTAVCPNISPSNPYFIFIALPSCSAACNCNFLSFRTADGKSSVCWGGENSDRKLTKMIFGLDAKLCQSIRCTEENIEWKQYLSHVSSSTLSTNNGLNYNLLQ